MSKLIRNFFVALSVAGTGAMATTGSAFADTTDFVCHGYLHSRFTSNGLRELYGDTDVQDPFGSIFEIRTTEDLVTPLTTRDWNWNDPMTSEIYADGGLVGEISSRLVPGRRTHNYKQLASDNRWNDLALLVTIGARSGLSIPSDLRGTLNVDWQGGTLCDAMTDRILEKYSSVSEFLIVPHPGRCNLFCRPTN